MELIFERGCRAGCPIDTSDGCSKSDVRVDMRYVGGCVVVCFRRSDPPDELGLAPSGITLDGLGPGAAIVVPVLLQAEDDSATVLLRRPAQLVLSVIDIRHGFPGA